MRQFAVVVLALCLGCNKTPSLFPEGYKHLELGQPFDEVLTSLASDPRHRKDGVYMAIDVGKGTGKIKVVEGQLPESLPSARLKAEANIEEASAVAPKLMSGEDLKRALIDIRNHERTALYVHPETTLSAVIAYFKARRLDKVEFYLQAEGAEARRRVLHDLQSKYGEPNEEFLGRVAWTRCKQAAEIALSGEDEDTVWISVRRLTDEQLKPCADTPRF